MLPGLFFVGDSVATTTPVFGRGITTTLLAVRGAAEPARPRQQDLGGVGLAFDAWSDDLMRPWVEDHIHMDGDHVRGGRAATSTSTRRSPPT